MTDLEATDIRSPRAALPLFADPAARAFRRSLLMVVIAGILALVAMAAVAGWLMLRSQAYNRWINHTYLVDADVAGFEALVERAETARRGYLLTPNQRYRDAYASFHDKIPTQLDRIAIDTFDNPASSRLVVRARALVAQRASQIDQTMSLASAGRIDEAVNSFRSSRDQELLAQIRQLAADLRDQENALLKKRAQNESDNSTALFAVVLVGAVLLVLLAVAASLLMVRYASDLDLAHRQLRRLNNDLESRVKSRTSQLSRANEEIQRFAYIVSHDLRSPLVNVMGFTTELELCLEVIQTSLRELNPGSAPRSLAAAREAIDKDMPEAIGFIRSSTKKMDGLINAILRLSREGRRALAVEPLNMGRLVQDLFGQVRHRLADAGAEARIEGVLPDLVSDRMAVEQVFGNLIDNAVKYLAPGRPGEIVVRGWVEGDGAVYEVQDNGRGVAPRDHERIFELFRRAGRQDQAGEGIGLAHVRALVYRLGGVIACKSELDQGASFQISLPLVLSLSEP